jgi:hypothetical protein
MKRECWKSATRSGKEVTFTCHERTPRLVDITAQLTGKEHFHIQLDIPSPISRADVEKRFATMLEEDK